MTKMPAAQSSAWCGALATVIEPGGGRSLWERKVPVLDEQRLVLAIS
jgi:hypothetical protein